MNCPACGGKMVNVLFVCGTCWWKVPAKDRQQLHHMHINRQPTASKIAKIVRELKESSHE